ncbi:hypothetical protein ACLB2K_072575 [Fragaria x ananassa]
MKAKKLSSIFASARIKYKPLSASATKSLYSPADDAGLKSVSASEDSSGQLSSILCRDASPHLQPLEKELDLSSWISDLSHSANDLLTRKEVSRERRSRFCLSDKQVTGVDKLLDMCASRLGTEVTLLVFSKIKKETGIKECNALIKKCIEGARIATEEVAAEKHMQLAFKIFKSMKEQGFPLEEETYGPFLEYLIDMGMTKDFCFLCGVIKNGNPSSLTRLGYYEMSLWVRVNHEEKIQGLCDDIESFDGVNKSLLQENYLSVLCESNQVKEILRLLESMDITKLSSPYFVARIFKCLGRLLLESYAEKLLLEFKACDCAEGNTSNLIYSYVDGIPNLAVEDIISKFRNLHTKLEVTPSSASYEKLIIYCCDSLQVHAALELVDEMFELGLTCSLEALHSVLQASSENCDFNLVHQIYSVIKRGNLKPNGETFRSMINLCVKMKDYEGAYSMLRDLEKMRVTPTTAMYNAIMVGYFREKNMSRGLKVLKEMKEANLQPDSQTFSHLITNCNSEEDINMYYKEMKQSGIHATKQVFMALINAYAACGQFDKAKQVLSDKGIPQKSFNEIRSVLVQALASHGQLSNAFNIYEQIKEAGCSLEPKAVISLIEHLQSDEVALSRLLPLLETVKDPNYWLDGCLRAILYCVRYKHLRTAVNLLEQLRDQVCTDELALEVIFDKVFSFIAESESSLQFGLDLLHAMKSELGLTPSRKCLDFLLHACVSAKDLQSSIFVWQEYQAAGLPYNTLSFLRMYQALLASGDRKAAKVLEHRIPKDIPHVQSIIEASKEGAKEKDHKEDKAKDEKKAKEKDGVITAVYKVNLHCPQCAREIKKPLISIQGVHNVEVEREKGEIKVKGDFDPTKIQKRLEKLCKKKVELVSPKVQIKESTTTETIVVKESKTKEVAISRTTLVKVHMHCHKCEQDLKKKLLTNKGVHNVRTDMKAQTLAVEGTIDPEKLVSYLRKKVHKHAEIIPPKQEKKDETKEKEKSSSKPPEKKDEKKEKESGKSTEIVTKVVEAKEEIKVVEVKTKEGGAPYFIHYVYAPQIFSDENPNACSIM